MQVGEQLLRAADSLGLPAAKDKIKLVWSFVGTWFFLYFSTYVPLWILINRYGLCADLVNWLILLYGLSEEVCEKAVAFLEVTVTDIRRGRIVFDGRCIALNFFLWPVPQSSGANASLPNSSYM